MKLGTLVTRMLIALLTIASVALVAPRARASDSALSCWYEDQISLDPGFTDQHGPYAWESVGRASITCFGQLEGETLAGTGWFVEKGNGEGTCYKGTGFVDIEGALPTADGGEIEVSGHMVLTRAGLTGVATGFFNGVFVAGPYAAQPSTDRFGCSVGTPVTSSTLRGTVTSVPADEIFTPAAPTEFAVAEEEDGARLSWRPGNDETVETAGFRVYRDGRELALVDAGTHSFRDETVGTGTHTYAVAAYSVEAFEVDRGVTVTGLESELAGPVNVSIGPDEEPTFWTPLSPDPELSPWNLRARAIRRATTDVELAWKAPRSGEPTHYAIYSNRDRLNAIATTTSTDFTDAELAFSCNRSYTYYVAAIAVDGTEYWSDPVTVGPFAGPESSC